VLLLLPESATATAATATATPAATAVAVIPPAAAAVAPAVPAAAPVDAVVVPAVAAVLPVSTAANAELAIVIAANNAIVVFFILIPLFVKNYKKYKKIKGNLPINDMGICRQWQWILKNVIKSFLSKWEASRVVNVKGTLMVLSMRGICVFL
jgi:hypothetical protein